MGGTMTKVLPGLYIGGLENAKNDGELIANCISHILVVQTTKKELEDQSPSRQYLHICISEHDNRSLIRRIPETNTFIHQARSESGNVLVCSESGISTNIAVVSAYLMTVYALDSRSAMGAVQGLQHAAVPIPALLHQLDRFGAAGEPPAAERGFETGDHHRSFTSSPKEAPDSLVTVVGERRRLKESFGDWPGYEEDLQQLLEAIRSFKSLSDSGVLLRDPTSPEMWTTASPTDFDVSSGFSAGTESSQSRSAVHSTRSTPVTLKGPTRLKSVKLTPPCTPPSTPVCFASDECIDEKGKGQTTPITAPGADDFAEQDSSDLPKPGDCSPPVTLNETDLFPGDAPIIGIDDFALRYCQKVAELHEGARQELDTSELQQAADSAPAPYEIGVEVTDDADVNCEEEEDDDDVPGAIEIVTGFGARQARPVATSYHPGLAPGYALPTRLEEQQVFGPGHSAQPQQQQQQQQDTAALRVPGDTRRRGADGAGRLSTTVPAIRSFLPF